jgi:hypothetical protein
MRGVTVHSIELALRIVAQRCQPHTEPSHPTRTPLSISGTNPYSFKEKNYGYCYSSWKKDRNPGDRRI